jgi:chemotaxis response regulator CheB
MRHQALNSLLLASALPPAALMRLKLFYARYRAKSGMAYVFVQHLSREHTSTLPEILQKVAPFPVHQITDNIHLKPDNPLYYSAK